MNLHSLVIDGKFEWVICFSTAELKETSGNGFNFGRCSRKFQRLASDSHSRARAKFRSPSCAPRVWANECRRHYVIAKSRLFNYDKVRRVPFASQSSCSIMCLALSARFCLSKSERRIKPSEPNAAFTSGTFARLWRPLSVACSFSTTSYVGY